MHQRLLVSTFIGLIFAGSFWGRWHLQREPLAAPLPSTSQRIISLSPGITETLFALHVGQRCIGVTDYCIFPPEATKIDAIGGGLMDLHLERMIQLDPDLLVGRHDNEQGGLVQLPCRQVFVSHKSFAGLVASFSTIGDAVGQPEAGRQMAEDFRQRVTRIANVVKGRPQPRVLLCIYRPYDTGDTRGVTVPTRGLMAELIELAGGTNACQQSAIRFPVLSAEGVLQMQPEVIVKLVRPDATAGLSNLELLAQWNVLPELPAVQQQRLAVIDDDFAMVPGPRFILLIEKLARILHPEAPWDERD